MQYVKGGVAEKIARIYLGASDFTISEMPVAKAPKGFTAPDKTGYTPYLSVRYDDASNEKDKKWKAIKDALVDAVVFCEQK